MLGTLPNAMKISVNGCLKGNRAMLKSRINIMLLIASLVACAGRSFAQTVPPKQLAASVTFCNPLNLDYGWKAANHRHAADPVIVLFKN